MNERSQRLFRIMFGARLIATAPGLVLMYALFGAVPDGSTIFVIVAPAVVMHHAVGFWHIRRRPLPDGVIALHVAGSLLLAFVPIWVTGGAGSPVIVPFVGLAPVLGFFFGATRFAAPMLALLATVDVLAVSLPPVDGAVAAQAPMLRGIVTVTGIVVLGLVGIFARRAIEAAERRADEARDRALRELTHRNSELMSLSSTIAHELKNPLTSIIGLAQLLLREAPPDTKLAERLGVLHREALRTSTVLESLRTFARPVGDLVLTPLDPRRLANEALSIHEAMARDRRVTLAVAGAAPTAMTGDSEKLLQALSNLVRNGIEACSSDGRVTISIEPDDELVHLAVTDDGPGFSASIQTAGPTFGDSSKPDGSGIGLVLVRSIARQHGGDLRLTSGPDGRGARAVITVPRQVPA